MSTIGKNKISFKSSTSEHKEKLKDKYVIHVLNNIQNIDGFMIDVLNSFFSKLNTIPTSSCESHPSDNKPAFYITFFYDDRTNYILNEIFDEMCKLNSKVAFNTGLIVRVRCALNSRKDEMDKRISIKAHISSEIVKSEFCRLFKTALDNVVLELAK